MQQTNSSDGLENHPVKQPPALTLDGDAPVQRDARLAAEEGGGGANLRDEARHAVVVLVEEVCEGVEMMHAVPRGVVLVAIKVCGRSMAPTGMVSGGGHAPGSNENMP